MAQHDDGYPAWQLFAGCAFFWALGFGLLSLAWAAGSEIGVDKLSPTIRDQTKDRDSGAIAILIATGLLKILGGLVPLALVNGWLPRARRLFSFLTIAGGVFLLLYGIGDVVGGGLRYWGIIDGTDQAARDAAFWYVVLWGPIWIVGGVLFLGTWIAWRNANTRYQGIPPR